MGDAVSARYFRSSVAVYEAVRAQLDAAWGYPSPDGKTLTAITPASHAVTDAGGRVHLVVDANYCDYVLPSQLLPQLLSAGAVEEISEATYRAALPQPGP